MLLNCILFKLLELLTLPCRDSQMWQAVGTFSPFTLNLYIVP